MSPERLLEQVSDSFSHEDSFEPFKSVHPRRKLPLLDRGLLVVADVEDGVH